MRITILATAALSIISITQASYILNMPMERGQGQGGALSDGSIKFTNRTLPVEPLLGEWVDKGLPINCSAWTPLPNTVNKDQSFEQSSTCSQEQTRTVEEQVKNLDTGVISKTGNKSEESQTISVVKKQSVSGTGKCVYGFNWGAGYWIESSNNTTNFMWYGPSFGSNETLNKTLEGHPTSYTQAGYTYRRGLYNNGSGGGNIYYSICRE